MSTLAGTAPQRNLSIGTPNQRAYRLDAIDMLRGLVIVIMAIDHVRDFFMAGARQDPMANPNITAALFFTRWITHFCAPVFVCLAGVSAGLMSQRKSRIDLTRFLFTRGVWLIFVEIFIIATAGSFAPFGTAGEGGKIFVSMQVIWAIGACMVLLAAFQWLGRPVCFWVGVAIVACHNVLDPIWPASKLADQQWPLWVALHSQMTASAGPYLLHFAYPLLPWFGVMAFGFGVSGVFEQPPSGRNSLLWQMGLALTADFIVLRAFSPYGDPRPWRIQTAGLGASILQFLNAAKYPPSLDYLLMTLGPAAIVCSFADRITGRIKSVLVMFGRVPFAFYVAHFFLIHLLSVMLGLAQGYSMGQMMTNWRFYPTGYGIGLAGVYLVWLLVVVLLYPLCHWMAKVKARRRDWWLSYL